MDLATVAGSQGGPIGKRIPGWLNSQVIDYKHPARYLRYRIRRLLAFLRNGKRLSTAPVLFANAFPKSGTHLLLQMLQGFPDLGPAVDSGMSAIVTFDGPSGAPRPETAILADLARLRAGDIAYGHLHASPAITAALTRPGVACYFLVRDPRDVVVSHVHYVTEMEPRHVHHHFYRSLPDFESRLRTSILGRPDSAAPFPDIAARFAPYLGWLRRPEVCLLRFEDLIARREESAGEIIDHAAHRGFQLLIPREQACQRLAASVDPQRSPTFRSGRTGAWENQFSPETRSLFKQVAGELLVGLGYEQDLEW